MYGSSTKNIPLPSGYFTQAFTTMRGLLCTSLTKIALIAAASSNERQQV